MQLTSSLGLAKNFRHILFWLGSRFATELKILELHTDLVMMIYAHLIMKVRIIWYVEKIGRKCKAFSLNKSEWRKAGRYRDESFRGKTRTEYINGSMQKNLVSRWNAELYFWRNSKRGWLRMEDGSRGCCEGVACVFLNAYKLFHWSRLVPDMRDGGRVKRICLVHETQTEKIQKNNHIKYIIEIYSFSRILCFIIFKGKRKYCEQRSFFLVSTLTRAWHVIIFFPLPSICPVQTQKWPFFNRASIYRPLSNNMSKWTFKINRNY